MCGRYTLTAGMMDLEPIAWIGEIRSDHQPRYNITPGQHAPVVRRNRAGQRMLERMRWGFVPSWAEVPDTGYRLVNAPCETAPSEPAFHRSFRYRRCLILTDGFYKTLRRDGGPRQPCWIHRPDHSVFSMAGLWEEWGSKEREETLYSFTILTVPVTNPGERAYERVPAVLDAETRERWMKSRTSTDELRRLLLSTSVDDFNTRLVSRYVMDPTNEGPECIEPVEFDEVH